MQCPLYLHPSLKSQLLQTPKKPWIHNQMEKLQNSHHLHPPFPFKCKTYSIAEPISITTITRTHQTVKMQNPCASSLSSVITIIVVINKKVLSKPIISHVLSLQKQEEPSPSSSPSSLSPPSLYPLFTSLL